MIIDPYRFPSKALPGEMQVGDGSRNRYHEVKRILVDLAISDVEQLSGQTWRKRK